MLKISNDLTFNILIFLDHNEFINLISSSKQFQISKDIIIKKIIEKNIKINNSNLSVLFEINPYHKITFISNDIYSIENIIKKHLIFKKKNYKDLFQMIKLLK